MSAPAPKGYQREAVVDEAHHGFATAKEAVRFYRESLKPDFTLMITATPDDAELNTSSGRINKHFAII